MNLQDAPNISSKRLQYAHQNNFCVLKVARRSWFTVYCPPLLLADSLQTGGWVVSGAVACGRAGTMNCEFALQIFYATAAVINIHVPWVWLHWTQSASTTINTEILSTSMLHVYDSLSTTVIILLILAMTSHTGYLRVCCSITMQSCCFVIVCTALKECSSAQCAFIVHTSPVHLLLEWSASTT